MRQGASGASPYLSGQSIPQILAARRVPKRKHQSHNASHHDGEPYEAEQNKRLYGSTGDHAPGAGRESNERSEVDAPALSGQPFSYGFHSFGPNSRLYVSRLRSPAPWATGLTRQPVFRQNSTNSLSPTPSQLFIPRVLRCPVRQEGQLATGVSSLPAA